MQQTILSGIVPPLAATGLAALALWQPWRKQPPRQSLALAATPVAIAVGYITADILVNGFKGILPVAGLDYRPHAAALGAILGLVALRAPRHLTTILIALAIAGLSVWMRRRVLLTDEPPQREVLYALGTTVAGTLVHLILSRAARTQSAHTPLLPLGIALTGLAIAIVQSGSASLSQMAGALAATLGPIGLVAVLRPHWPIAQAAIAPITLTAVALLIAWRINTSTLNPLSQVAIAAALAAPALAFLPPLSNKHPWPRSIACAIAAAACSAAAIALTPNRFDFSGL